MSSKKHVDAFSILPNQFGVIADPLGASVGLHVLVVIVFAISAALAFWRLALLSGKHPD